MASATGNFPVQSGNFGYTFGFSPRTGNGVWSLNMGYQSSLPSLFESPTEVQNLSGQSGMSYSSALSSPYLLLGSPSTERVRVYINEAFVNVSGNNAFVPINELTGFATSGVNISGFGSTVAARGGVAAIGAPDSDIINATGGGVVFLYNDVLTGGMGSTGSEDWGLLGFITGTQLSGSYGKSVALAQLNSSLLVAGGAPNEGSGSGVMYLHNSASQSLIKKLTPTGQDVQNFGKSVAFAEVSSVKYVVVGYDYGETGKVKIYKESAAGLNDYTESQDIGPELGHSGDKYAYVIDSNSGTFLVGAPEYNGAGRAFYYTFNEEEGIFEESQQIYPSDLGADQQFGKSIAFDGVNGVITSNKDSGKGYIYYLNGNSWGNISSVSGNLNKISGSFGGNVSGSNTTVFEGDVLFIGTDNEEYSYYFSTGASVVSEYTGMSINGSGGKLFDGDGNFLYGYNTENRVSISGCVFREGYYTMFVNSTLCNSHASRERRGYGLTGALNSWTTQGTEELSYYALSLWEPLTAQALDPVPYALDATYDISVTPDLHLDASILDGSRASNNPTNGASVNFWGDRSSNNNDFEEVTNKPLFRESLLRGKAGVEFDGTDDILSDPDFFSSVDFAAEEATMIVVAIPGRDGAGGFGVGTSDATYQLVKTSAETTSTDAYSDVDYSANFLSSRIDAVALDSLYRQTPTSRPFINGVKIDASDYKLYTNKRQRFAVSMSGKTFSVDLGVSLGGVGTANPLSGYILEVLIFNKVIEDSDWDTIHAYLSAKYGLNIYKTLSSSTYALDGTYSVSLEPQFHFDASEAGTVLNSAYASVADGGDVYYWKDKANHWYAVQTTAARQPNFVSSRTIGGSVESSSAIYFDGGGDSLELWFAQYFGDYTNADKTVVVVFEPETPGTGELLGIGADDGVLLWLPNSYCGTMRSARLGAVSLSAITATNGQVVEMYSDAAGNTYDISAAGSAAITQTTTSWANDMFSGGKVPQIGGTSLSDTAGEEAGARFKGWIYEILIFDNVVTSADKTALVAYAENKYGL